MAFYATQGRHPKIRLVEVKVKYLEDGEPGAVSILGDDDETARDQAFELVPDGACAYRYYGGSRIARFRPQFAPQF